MKRLPLLTQCALIFGALFVADASCAIAQVTHSFTEPYQQSKVAASEIGVVGSIYVTEGQAVSEGDVLADLKHEELTESLKMAELRAASVSKIDSAESTLRLRKRRRDTLEPLFTEGHANQEEYEEAKLAYELASAELQLAREQKAEAIVDVARIKAMINAKTIRSPIDGVITEIAHQRGEYISANNPQFANVAQLERLKARFYLLIEGVDSLQAGDPVMLNVYVGAAPQRIKCTVDFVSPVTDPDSGTVRVDVLIENRDQQFRSGAPCEWISRLESSAEALPSE